MNDVNALIIRVYNEIGIPVIWVLASAAAIVFFWGVAEMIRNADSPDARNEGRSHIIWGIIGFAIMVSVFGIIEIVSNTLGEGGKAGIQDTFTQ